MADAYGVPTVGVPWDEHRAVCVYAQEPGDPQCDDPATVHVRAEDARYGTVAMASCDRHAPIARAAGQFVAEHAYQGYCGFPATIWHDRLNICVLDDSGEEPGLSGHADQRTLVTAT